MAHTNSKRNQDEPLTILLLSIFIETKSSQRTIRDALAGLPLDAGGRWFRSLYTHAEFAESDISRNLPTGAAVSDRNCMVVWKSRNCIRSYG